MDSTRIFTPARIVALGLIAAVVGGLAYLNFKPADLVFPESFVWGDVAAASRADAGAALPTR